VRNNISDGRNFFEVGEEEIWNIYYSAVQFSPYRPLAISSLVISAILLPGRTANTFGDMLIFMS